MKERENINRFLKISNIFFNDTSKYNYFARIGAGGFCLYTYLLYKQGYNNSCEISIRMIQTFLNREYKNRKTLNYGSKEHKVKCLKDKSTITKYLQALENNKLIKIINDGSSIKQHITNNINEIMIIKLTNTKSENKENNLFTKIPEDLFFDNVYKIGCIGWSIFCLLAKLHNKNFGSISCEGFANPSQKYMSEILKVNEDTIRAYCLLLEELKLIKIQKQEPIFKCIGLNGENIYEYLPNNYVVKYKMQGNKYYIGI